MSGVSGEESSGQELKTAYWNIGGKIRSVQYTEIDGYAITEGCLIIGEAEKVADAMAQIIAQPHVLDPQNDTQGYAIVGRRFRWPDATMAYEIDPELPDKDRVHNAMAHWTEKTGIKFLERNSSNRHEIADFVYFKKSNRCASHVGRVGEKQSLLLGPNCSLGNTIHEIGHALGLWHEQCRNDRDAHIRINWENVKDGMAHNFNQKLQDGEDVGSYDYDSIMHYGPNFFSKNGEPTIEIISGHSGEIGQRDGLSAGDIATIKRMYDLP